MASRKRKEKTVQFVPFGSDVGSISGGVLDGVDKGEHGVKSCSVGGGASIDMNSAVSVFTCRLVKGVFSE